MAASLPTLTVQAQFTPGTWTDISTYVLNLQVTRPSTRLQGPLWQYQAGTCQVVLDNSDGRFDPDNLAGPYISATSLRQVVWTAGPGQMKTWTAPANLSGTTVKVECWGPGAAGGAGAAIIGTAGAGGGGGEYAAELTYAVVPRHNYVVVTPVNGGTASTTFDGTGVVAHAASGTTGGTGSSNSIHFNGGAGGAGGTSAGGLGFTGGGGGSSGGSAAGGNAGQAGNSGGGGGAAVTGGYAGGAGVTGALYRGQSGKGPGGGGGGGGQTPPGWGVRGSGSAGGTGKGGQVRLTYFVIITPSATVTQVLPRVPVQVTALWSAVTYPLFSGFADSWTETPVTYSAGYSEFTLTCTDGFKVLAGNNLAALGSPVGAAEDSGSRIDRILDWAAWSPAARAIDAGDTNQQATSFGSDALSLLQLTADTEIGEVYVNGSGSVVFRHRRAILTDARSTTPQAVFGDLPGTSHTAGTEIAYAAVGRADDDTTLANDIQVTVPAYSGDPSPVLQEATDPVSVYVFQGQRSYVRSDLMLPDDPTAFQYANWVLFISKDAEDRFDTLTVDPQADTANLWPQVLGRDIGDRIQVWRRPSGVAAPVTKDVFIRGIAHTFDPGSEAWQTIWTLQSALKYAGFLILDSATSGLLDVDALAY